MLRGKGGGCVVLPVKCGCPAGLTAAGSSRLEKRPSPTLGTTSKEFKRETKASFLRKASQTAAISRNNPKNQPVINII